MAINLIFSSCAEKLREKKMKIPAEGSQGLRTKVGEARRTCGWGDYDVEVGAPWTTAQNGGWRSCVGGQERDQENQESWENLISVFGNREMVRCKLFQRKELQLLVLINIIIKSPKPDLAYMCLCASLYPLQQDVPALKCSHSNSLQDQLHRCYVIRDYGLYDSKAETVHLPSSFDVFTLFFLAINTYSLRVRFSFQLFIEYPLCSRNCVHIRNKE